MGEWDEIDRLREKYPKLARTRHPLAEGLSPDRARAFFANQRIEQGFHPMGMKLRDPRGEKCGGCKHLYAHATPARRNYFKCDLVGCTAGPGTDIRKKWPACVNWEPRA